MKMILPFIGGPLHGIKFEMEWIPQLHVCIEPRDRLIYCYLRDEMAYFYDKDLSAKMSAQFDLVRAKFPGKANTLKPVE